MDNNEELIKLQMQQNRTTENRTADNGNHPGGSKPANNATVTINDILATGQHTNTGSFQAESSKPSDAPESSGNGQDKAENAFKGETGGTTAGALIGGDLAVDLMDLALPAIFVFVTVKIGYKLDRKELQLTAKEKATIAPAMQAVLDRMSIDMNNPYANLALIMSIVYGSKLMAIAPDLEKITPKKSETDKLIENINIVAETVETIETDAELTPQQKYDAELKVLLRNHQKRSKKTYARITEMFERDGTLKNLRKKYKV